MQSDSLDYLFIHLYLGKQSDENYQVKSSQVKAWSSQVESPGPVKYNINHSRVYG